MAEPVTFACEKCGFVSKDMPDPTFTGPWLCYHCHCLEQGQDPKTALNLFAEMLKIGYLVKKTDAE